MPTILRRRKHLATPRRHLRSRRTCENSKPVEWPAYGQRLFNRSLRQLFPGSIPQRHDFTAVAVECAPPAAFHEPVLAVAVLRAAAADHGPAVLEGKPPVIARRDHHPQLAVEIADLAVDRRSCPPLDEIVRPVVVGNDRHHAAVPPDIVEAFDALDPDGRNAVLVERQRAQVLGFDPSLPRGVDARARAEILPSIRERHTIGRRRRRRRNQHRDQQKSKPDHSSPLSGARLRAAPESLLPRPSLAMGGKAPGRDYNFRNLEFHQFLFLNSSAVHKSRTMTTSDALGARARQAMIDIFRKKDVTAIDRNFAASFMQHDPNLADGLAGMRSFAGEIASSPAADITIYRTLVDGDFVLLHSRYEGVAPYAGPAIAFDLFRFKDGKIVEHWGGQASEKPPNASGRTEVDGPTDVRDREKTEANRTLVRTYRETIIVALRFDRIEEFVDSALVQHASKLRDGIAQLRDRIASVAKEGGQLYL